LNSFFMLFLVLTPLVSQICCLLMLGSFDIIEEDFIDI
jgi:hypothetical protein